MSFEIRLRSGGFSNGPAPVAPMPASTILLDEDGMPLVQPLTASLNAANINALLAAAAAGGGGVVKLVPYATYLLTEAIIRQSNTRLHLNRAIISRDASWAPSVGLADDPTNAMIKSPGVITGTVNTTLSARAVRRASSLVVASATGIFAGQYLEISGTNANEEGLSEGANMVTTDLVQVDASYVSGTTIPLTGPTKVWHASGHTVKSVSGVIFNSDVVDGTVKAPGGTIAVGILDRYALGSDLDDLTFEGFSRGGICIDKGSFGWRVNKIRGTGELNALVFVDGAHQGRATNLGTHPAGLRYHANGVARGLIHVHNDSSNVTFDGGQLAHGSCGVWVKHGHNVKVLNVTLFDFDPAEAYLRTVAAGEQSNTDFFAIVQTGSTPVPWAAFVGGVTFKNITVDAPSTLQVVAHGLWCFALHDAFGFMGHGLTVNNSSDHGLMRGIHCKDTSGSLTTTQVKGVDYGLRMEGSFGIDGVVSDYLFSNLRNPGYANTAIGLSFGADPTVPPVVFTKVVLSSNEGIRLDSPAGVVMPDMVIHDILVHGREYKYIIPVVNKTGGALNQVGEFAEFEPAAATIADVPRVRTPTGQSRKMAVIACGPFDNPGDGNVCWVAPLTGGQTCPIRIRSADTIQPGDYIDVDLADGGNTKPGKLNNASAAPNAIAVSYKTSGAAEAFIRATGC